MMIQTENRKVESSQNKDKQNKFLTHKRLNQGSTERDQVKANN